MGKRNLNYYTLEEYIKDIDTNGLKETWHTILSHTLNGDLNSNVFYVENYGELYEIELEHVNKISKKEMGKYYTPRDVATVMSNWLLCLKGDNVCDVGCGVGNLILNYLSAIGKEKAVELLVNKKIYIYDIDEIALEICKYSIALEYGKEYLEKINVECCDFLNQDVSLPKDAKVIANPPYHKIKKIEEDWGVTDVLADSKELYSAFMEKIIKQSKSSVIITPYSYIGSSKFYSLRKVMNQYNGFIVSFDNVPGNIFNGKKHGIFNSNKGNSVRAAITVVENKDNVNGFRCSPLIRFKTEERSRMLDNDYLYSLVNDRYQIVNARRKAYYKCHIDLLNIFDKWEEVSNKKMNSLLNQNGIYKLYVPTTCRYYTVGSKKNLSRDGKRILGINDLEQYNYVYCMLNSSFAYWYWRLYDGGINCSLTIIKSIPIFCDLLNDDQRSRINRIAEEMQRKESEYLVYKNNAGKPQENIKFPIKYREEINRVFFEILGVNEDIRILNMIHSSSLFGDTEGGDYE